MRHRNTSLLSDHIFNPDIQYPLLTVETMQVFLPSLVLFSTLGFTRALKFEPPNEKDVTSPNFCKLNDAGFGGAQLGGSDPQFLKYKCKIEYTGAVTEEEAIEQVDRKIAEFVLGTPYFSGCSRRLVQTMKQRDLQLGVGAKAIAISTLPADEKNSGKTFRLSVGVIHFVVCM